MHAYFLAFIFVTELASVAPQMISPHTTLDACLAEALKENNRNPIIREGDNFERGAQFVCLQIRLPV